MSDAAPPAPKIEKPARSWRTLLTELVIVVVGVGLALAAQQAAEWLRWRNEVAQAREVIATELATNLAGAIARLRTEHCTERRLDELAVILDAASRAGRLPPVGDIDLPPRSLWPTGAWDSVVASQTATHFPSQNLAAISGIYKMIQRIEQFNVREIDDWRDIYAMVGPGRRLDPASEAVLRQALSRARMSTRAMTTLSAQLANRVKEEGISFGRQDLDGIARIEKLSLKDVAAPNLLSVNTLAMICAPIGAVALSYGQGALNAVRALSPEGVKTWPDFAKDGR